MWRYFLKQRAWRLVCLAAALMPLDPVYIPLA